LSRIQVTLEERMYIPTFEALVFLDEYFDPQHPITKSKGRAVIKLKTLERLLKSSDWQIPNISIVKERADHFRRFRRNLVTQLTPSIEQEDKDDLKKGYLALEKFHDYLLNPQVSALVKINESMSSLPRVSKRGILQRVWMNVTTRRVLPIILIVITACVVFHVDTIYMNANSHDAFSLTILSSIGLIGVYATYLTLRYRKE